MTDLDEYTRLPFDVPEPDPTAIEREPRKCRRHLWVIRVDAVKSPTELLPGTHIECVRCGKSKDPAVSRRNTNNRKRGNAEELTVARAIGGRKVGPLGQPWDVEMPGYARLQVKKLASPPSLRFIAAELARIGSGPSMPGFIWIEPGRGGEKLIVFRLADFAERHGVPSEP